MKALISAVFTIFLAANVFAQLDGNPENWCRNGAFPRESESYEIAKIKGNKGEKVYFYNDFEEDCPNNEKCREKSYIIPNDEVIVSRRYGNWICAWYQPKKGSETVGWIRADKVEFIKIKQSFNDIFGSWYFYDNDIEIKKDVKTNGFKVTGNAFWKGLGDNVHTGELDHEGRMSDGILKLGEDETDEYACRVSIILLGKFLIVSDNLNCGGANVSFSGVYQKNKK
ncbi:MAG: hypothetical protein LUM44_14320 [Pyrinomonadaceae bacterium]|nr:hypothetical protein [Pyrinomonadaceae bacterium]